MASIQFKKSAAGKKIYYVVVSNRARRKWIKAGNQKNAKYLKKQIEALEETQRIEKLGFSSNEMRIDDFFQKYSEHIKLHTSASTVKRYLNAINAFINFLNMFHPRIRSLSQINAEIIESYQKIRLSSLELKAASDGRKIGVHKNKKLPLPQTVNFELNVLRTAFTWARDHQLLSEIPTAKVKKLKPRLSKSVKILSKEECQIFLKIAREIAKSKENMKIYYYAFKFLLNTGLRSGELCNLTWNDVDLETGLIKIQPKEGWTPKTYSRQFFLNAISIRLLKGLRDKHGYILKTLSGKKLSPDHLRRALVKIARKAGLEDFTRVHDLRHTFNSLMQMNGVDPATMGKILGHKDIETTMIYTHQTEEHLKKSIEKVGI